MQLELKPYPWSCLATSFAMALGINTTVFQMLAGHHGGEIVFPELPEPQCRRGFHASEAAYVAMLLGHSATPLELFPMIAPSAGTYGPSEVLYGETASPQYNRIVFDGLIHNTRGVIECRTRLGNWHAVAYDHGTIFDPDGRVFAYSPENCEARGLFTTRLWRVEKNQ